MILTDYTLNINIEVILKLQTREFRLYWARIEGNRAFWELDTADMYVVRVCEISFFLKRNSHESCIRQLSMRQSLSKVNSIAPTFSSRLSSFNSCAVIMSSSDDSLDIELDSELFQEPPGYFLPPLPYTSTKFTLISGQAINLRLVGHNPLWVLTSSLWRLFARLLL